MCPFFCRWGLGVTESHIGSALQLQHARLRCEAESRQVEGKSLCTEHMDRPACLAVGSLLYDWHPLLQRANMKDRVVIGAGLLFFALCVAVVWAQRFKWIWNTLHWWVSWGGWFASLPLGLVWGGGFAQLPPLSTELTADLSPHPSSAAWPSIPPGTSEMDEL